MKNFIKTHLIMFVLFVMTSGLFLNSCKKAEEPSNEEQKKMEAKFETFKKEYLEFVKPVLIKMNTAYFEASINSNDENWKKVTDNEKIYNDFVSNKERFAVIKEIKESNLITDSAQAREIKLIYNEFAAKQVDTAKLNRLSEMTTALEGKYSKFRAIVGKKKLSDNEIEQVLKSSTNSKELEDTWKAHKEIGPIVATDIIALVKLRNEVAKDLGYSNYHEMSLKLSDQEPADVVKLFDELDNLTRDSFAKLKTEVDTYLATRLKIKTEELMPWHYQNRYFQEAPQIYPIDLDKYYLGKDIVKLTTEYYKGLNLPIDKLVANSDLFEKEGKNQHAYCITIDKDAPDIRVLCNIKDNSKWMETMLHEYGHALYDNYYAKDYPWVFKSPAHIFTTEAIAMLFGRFASNAEWMKVMLGLNDKETAELSDIARKTLKLQQLVFSRWSQVMFRFESAMYANPDQDLNKLWWDLVEKYQMIKRPADRNMPDWATKIHIATSPCYYHNYHLGELLASQLYFTIADKVLGKANDMNLSFANEPKVGEFLIKNVFSVGSKYYWNDMIEKATGEKLTAKYYAKQFVD